MKPTPCLALLLFACAPDAAPTSAPAPAVASGPFDDTVVHTYHLSFTAEDWAALTAAPADEVRAQLVYDGVPFPDVGVRHKGNVTLDFGGDKLSWKLDFDEFVDGRRFFGLENVNLNNGFKDPTLMREKLAYAVHEAAGNVASRTSHARVHVTVPGLFDETYFGLFIFVEDVDKRWLRARLQDDEGALYSDGDFRWYGPDAPYVPEVYRLESKGTTDHSALVQFLDVLNNTPIDELEGALPEVFDVEHFLSWLAANTALSNMDGIPGGGGNCFVAHDVAEGRMLLIPWDMNEAFGSTSEGLSVDELLTLDVHEPVVFPGAQPLIERVLQVPAFRARYDDKLRALVDGAFSPESMQQRVDELRALITPHVQEDTRRDYDDDQFERSFEEDVPGLPDPPYPEGNVVIGLMRFVRERAASIREQL